jgi:predicted alpha/beta superfamily hydrolase
MNKPQKAYPIILLLDAYSSFKSFSSCTELMAHEKSIPSCIVIGFPQRKYTDFDSASLESKIDKLAKFIEEELFPYFEMKYNITKSIIWGQGKQSGLIVSYLMLNYPDLFNGYISDIPNFSLLKEQEYAAKIFDNIKDKKLDYYIFGNSHIEALNKEFLKNLENNAPEGLNWEYGITAKVINVTAITPHSKR